MPGFVLFQARQALLLNIPADVHPEFQDQRAIFCERLFEGIDLFEPGVEFVPADAAVHEVEQWRGVAAAEIDSDLSTRRQVHPVSPHQWPHSFGFKWQVKTAGCYPPRIHPLVEQIGAFRLPGAAHAGKVDEYRRNRSLAQCLLLDQKGVPERQLTLFELPVRYFLTQFSRLKHDAVLRCRLVNECPPGPRLAAGAWFVA